MRWSNVPILISINGTILTCVVVLLEEVSPVAGLRYLMVYIHGEDGLVIS